MEDTEIVDPARRRFLNTAALAGLAGAAIPVSVAVQSATAADKAAPAKYEVAAGQLDEYYLLSSGGHSGEMRIYGVP